ncbi:MAG: tRNA (adenosine(37)-N6)-threonylcarbamoyltransferase complex transferase subunit TsaD [Bdellovibrionota bacterium]
MKILGIETSCDETAAAVVDYSRGETRVLSNFIYSQVALHAPYGGIVPELAARKHIETLAALVRKSLEEAKTSMDEIEAIAATHGPGLIGSLLVGLSYAKALAFGRKIPFVGVNHVEAHLTSCWIEKPELAQKPFLGLVVSGGHTALFYVKKLSNYTRLGSTRDDAVGEAFDKAAKLLGLPYPGGPAIDRLAKEGSEKAVHFPRAQIKNARYAFSFSGLKTSVRHEIERRGGLTALSEKDKADVAASFQQAAIRALVLKALKAARDKKVDDVVIVGGVAANTRLRAECASLEKKEGLRFHFPAFKYCTDNGAMIAALGGRLLEAGIHHDETLPAVSRLPVGEAA